METEDRIDDFNGPYRFLSNFYSASVRYDGIVFPTAEHAFQAQKAVRPEDFQLILGAPTPSEAKRLGHTVQIRNDWDDVRLSVMEGVVRAKFSQNPDLARRLIDTYPRELAEGNHWGDTYWGTVNGQGENHLGKILMKVREELRAEIHRCARTNKR